jgi:2-oxoglutarate dehydrogenase E1 component
MNWDAFYGPNAGYAQELYERYVEDPESVDAATRSFFQRVGEPPRPETSPNGSRAERPTAVMERGPATVDVDKIVLAARLARGIREYGHLAARINPLGGERPGDPMIDPVTHGLTREDLEALPGTIVWPNDPDSGSCWDAIVRLREIYCGPLGYEFDHVDDYEERRWLHDQVEVAARPGMDSQRRRELLARLSQVEGFERFLHTVFPGQKRFSIEGTDMLVPMLDLLVQRCMGDGTREVLIGMAHRGRLNVLAHVLGKPYSAILAQFQSGAATRGTSGEPQEVTSPGWTGDVKYHLGGHRSLDEAGVHAEVTLADNPSHLEVVDPVVEGFARAAQDDRGRRGMPSQDVDRAVAVTIHGDAAFPGEGIVSETLNLGHLEGYSTGGSIRFIVNNQIGFTTLPEEGRSTTYASDVAKGFDIPIIHVNADAPEACLWAVELAHSYRQRFHKDVLIDLVGYRRWGHNEGDEPAFTQPGMYTEIGHHPTVRVLYGQQLATQGVVAEDDVQAMLDEVQAQLRQARDEAEAGKVVPPDVQSPEPVDLAEITTAVPEAELRGLHAALLDFPEDFSLHRTLQRLMERRRAALDTEGAVDWSLAETLAFASILADATPVRLTGQDTARGTFSQRHAVLVDSTTGQAVTPLDRLPQARASFAVYNSPLTETAVLGFEYGYTVHAPEALVLWEAQFGDFSNVGQVIIDQFITSGRAKWQSRPGLVLLLPHGYEGQGPEHSSARLERYLQLAAEGNVRVANCSTSAQYFHLLRLQAATLANDRRPLVLMTPKSLLRHPRAGSSLADLSHGHFCPVLDDLRGWEDANRVERVILATGKVAVDLHVAAESEETAKRVALARLELLYPFPSEDVRRVLERYPQASEVVWLQEEPQNMGAWNYVEPRLRQVVPERACLRYIGRPERASTAEGSAAAHSREQKRIMEEAFSLPEPASRKKARGVKNVG